MVDDASFPLIITGEPNDNINHSKMIGDQDQESSTDGGPVCERSSSPPRIGTEHNIKDSISRSCGNDEMMASTKTLV